MAKTAKITVSLPEELLQGIEQERLASGGSRSQFFRRAVEAYLRRQREREAIERYIVGYRNHPETEEEVTLSDSTLTDAFVDNPWEAETEQ